MSDVERCAIVLSASGSRHIVERLANEALAVPLNFSGNASPADKLGKDQCKQRRPLKRRANGSDAATVVRQSYDIADLAHA